MYACTAQLGSPLDDSHPPTTNSWPLTVTAARAVAPASCRTALMSGVVGSGCLGPSLPLAAQITIWPRCRGTPSSLLCTLAVHKLRMVALGGTIHGPRRAWTGAERAMAMVMWQVYSLPLTGLIRAAAAIT
jgi:hypothetical protein